MRIIEAKVVTSEKLLLRMQGRGMIHEDRPDNFKGRWGTTEGHKFVRSAESQMRQHFMFEGIEYFSLDVVGRQQLASAGAQAKMPRHGTDCQVIYPTSAFQDIECTTTRMRRVLTEYATSMESNRSTVGAVMAEVIGAMRIVYLQGEGIMINPSIRPLIDYGTQPYYEVCVTEPDILRQVERFRNVMVTWTKPNGSRVTEPMTESKSAGIQHLCDLLDGITIKEQNNGNIQ